MTEMTTTENEMFLASKKFEFSLAYDDGQAAKQHLAAGRPIYYGDDQYPEGLIRKYPDGHKQLVSVGMDGEIHVIRNL